MIMTPNLERHGTEESLSDEALGIGVAVARVDLGATVIEKHFTLRRADKGPDCEFSLELLEMERLCREVKEAWLALGSPGFACQKAEEGSKVFRRSLYVTEDMQVGELFSPANLKSIRPGYGMAPKNSKKVLGKRINKAVPRGTPLTIDLVDFANETQF